MVITPRLSCAVFHCPFPVGLLPSERIMLEFNCDSNLPPASLCPLLLLSQTADRLVECITSGSITDDLELEVAGSVLDIAPVDKGERQQQKFEQGKDEAYDGNDGLQQEASNMAVVGTGERIGYTHPSE